MFEIKNYFLNFQSQPLIIITSSAIPLSVASILHVLISDSTRQTAELINVPRRQIMYRNYRKKKCNNILN